MSLRFDSNLLNCIPTLQLSSPFNCISNLQAEEYKKPFNDDDEEGEESQNGEAAEENKLWRPKVDKFYPFNTIRTLTVNPASYFDEDGDPIKPLRFSFYAHAGGKSKVWTRQSYAFATYI